MLRADRQQSAISARPGASVGARLACKRAPFFEADLPDVMERLERSGKTVVLSSQAEVMLKRERNATADFAALDSHEIEINNAAGLYARAGRAYRIDPFMNAYNEATIAWMAKQGATHFCLPCELPSEAIAVADPAERALGHGVEVQVFGRASLAVSARCYHGRTKDNCLFVCENDPDGMPLKTSDGKSVLRINGIQTQSESYVDVLPETDALTGLGVTHLCLMPQAVDMVAVARVFRDHIDGVASVEHAEERLPAICGNVEFSNGFFHAVPGHRRVAMAHRA